MKIRDITYQNRRDFEAIYVCEGCGHEQRDGGYDDANFHNNIIPKMRCESCGKTGKEANADYRPLTPKYLEGYQI